MKSILLTFPIMFLLFMTSTASASGVLILVSDIDGPEIDYVEVSHESVVAGDEVSIRVGVRDESAIDRISIGLNSPGGTTEYFQCNDPTSSGECEFIFEIGEGHVVWAGEYSVYAVLAYDIHGNVTVEIDGVTSDWGWPTFTVADGVSDIDGPEIDYVEVSHESVVAGDEVSIRVGVRDESAIDRISIGLNSPGGTTEYFQCNDPTSSGECEFIFEIGEGHVVWAGEYSVYAVLAYDIHGNVTVEIDGVTSDWGWPTFTAVVYTALIPIIPVPSLTLWGMLSLSAGLLLLIIWRTRRSQMS